MMKFKNPFTMNLELGGTVWDAKLKEKSRSSKNIVVSYSKKRPTKKTLAHSGRPFARGLCTQRTDNLRVVAKR